MQLNWKEGPLAEGLRCYGRGEFFEAHEHWEAVWLRCEEPQKTFMQAIIQITAAFHHVRRGNRRGALSLLGRALGRLEGFPAEYGGLDVEGIREDLRAWRKALEAGHGWGSLEPPRIGGRSADGELPQVE